MQQPTKARNDELISEGQLFFPGSLSLCSQEEEERRDGHLGAKKEPFAQACVKEGGEEGANRMSFVVR